MPAVDADTGSAPRSAEACGMSPSSQSSPSSISRSSVARSGALSGRLDGSATDMAGLWHQWMVTAEWCLPPLCSPLLPAPPLSRQCRLLSLGWLSVPAQRYSPRTRQRCCDAAGPVAASCGLGAHAPQLRGLGARVPAVQEAVNADELAVR